MDVGGKERGPQERGEAIRCGLLALVYPSAAFDMNLGKDGVEPVMLEGTVPLPH